MLCDYPHTVDEEIWVVALAVQAHSLVLESLLATVLS